MGVKMLFPMECPSCKAKIDAKDGVYRPIYVCGSKLYSGGMVRTAKCVKEQKALEEKKKKKPTRRRRAVKK